MYKQKLLIAKKFDSIKNYYYGKVNQSWLKDSWKWGITNGWIPSGKNGTKNLVIYKIRCILSSCKVNKSFAKQTLSLSFNLLTINNISNLMYEYKTTI